MGNFCSKCGAWKGQLGLEPDVEMFIDHLVQICSEVKRVLREDGTFWLNMGDSYAGSGGYHSDHHKNDTGFQSDLQSEKGGSSTGTRANVMEDVKQKDLVGVPHRLMLALQKDGWYVRNDIIWKKKSAMPESVKDRCTTSHEHILFLSKSKDYFFDQDAIREPAKGAWGTRDREDGKYHNEGTGLNPHTGLEEEYSTANKRDVWTVNPAAFPDGHFAVFPEALIKPCIKAGSSEAGVCPECHAPWERVTEEETVRRDRPNDETDRHEAGGKVNSCGNTVAGTESETVRWEPTCEHDEYSKEDLKPAFVLDPFFGAGTTGVTATKLGRGYVGIDIAEEYCELAESRVEDEAEWNEGYQEREIPDRWKWLLTAEGVGEETLFDMLDSGRIKTIADVIRLVKSGRIADVEGVGFDTAKRMKDAYLEVDLTEGVENDVEADEEEKTQQTIF